MNKTLYHFGDSFAKADNFLTSFGIKVANHYGMKYLDFSDGGLSNDQIFQRIIENLHRFKKGDVILINFSYLSRFFTLDPNLEFSSTAKYFDDNGGMGTDLMAGFYKDREILMDYFLNYSYEYNVKIFKMFNLLLESLNKMGVTTYSVLLKKDTLYMGDKVIKPNEYDLGLVNELKFEPTYYDWLNNKGWKNEEECHYTKGIQDDLAAEYIKRIDEYVKITRNRVQLI